MIVCACVRVHRAHFCACKCVLKEENNRILGQAGDVGHTENRTQGDGEAERERQRLRHTQTKTQRQRQKDRVLRRRETQRCLIETEKQK